MSSLSFSPCIFKPHPPNTQSLLIGQLTDAWAGVADNKAAVLN